MYFILELIYSSKRTNYLLFYIYSDQVRNSCLKITYLKLYSLPVDDRILFIYFYFQIYNECPLTL